MIPLLHTALAAEESLPTSIHTLIAVIERAVNWLAALIGILATLAVIIAAVVYLTAGGNQERTQIAHRIIFFAVIAVVVAFASKGMIAIILYFVGG